MQFKYSKQWEWRSEQFARSKKRGNANVPQNERQFPMKNYCCTYCGKKYRCKLRQVIFLSLFHSGILTTNKSFWLEWKFSKYTCQIIAKFGYVLILLLAFLFRRRYCLSKHTIFCNQSNKSLSSNFYAEFWNSLPLRVQLLSRASKSTNFHNCPPSVSY